MDSEREETGRYVRAIELIRELAVFGCICGRNAYNDLAIPEDLPVANTLIALFGSWDKVARIAKLHPRSEYKSRRNRAVGWEVLRLSQELHRGLYGPTRAEWDIFNDIGVRAVELRPISETWQEVLDLAGFGLRLGPASYHKSRLTEIQNERNEYELAQIERDKTLRAEAEIEYGYGIKVYEMEVPVKEWNPLTHNYETIGTRIATFAK